MLIGGEEAGIWSSIKSTFSSATDSGQEQDEGLNIFCLATGHLYERLLKETSQKKNHPKKGSKKIINAKKFFLTFPVPVPYEFHNFCATGIFYFD